MPKSNKPLIISAFSDKNHLHNNQYSFSINLALWVHRGELTGPMQYVLEVDGKRVNFNEKTISPFDPPRLKNKDNLKKATWYFRNLSTVDRIGAGRHQVTVRILDDLGEERSRLKFRGIIEPYAPEVTELKTSEGPGNDALVFQVASRQLPEIMQLPLSVLSEIGTTLAARFRSGGVHRVYDLLAVDPGNHLIHHIHPHDVPDAVTKAQILKGLTWNTSKLNGYSLNQLVLFSLEELAQKTSLQVKRAKKMLSKIREVHMVLDRSIQDDIVLNAFLPHRHSGLSRVIAQLNQQDVSDRISEEKGILTFSLEDLEEGHHSLELDFYFHSGNKRRISKTFTIDQSGPEISLKSPGSFIKDSDLILEVELNDKWSDVDQDSIQLWLDDEEIGDELDFTAYGFTIRIPDISEGEHAIQVKATDLFGNAGTSDVWKIVVDRTPPIVEIYHPLSPHFTTEDQVLISGKIIEPNIEEVRLGDVVLPVDSNGDFESLISLDNEINVLSVEASDKAGNSSLSNVLKVYRLSDEQAVIRGTIVDENEQPLSGVKVLDQKSGATVWTDDLGHFVLTNLPEGSISLSIIPPSDDVLSTMIPIEVVYGEVVDLQKVFLFAKGEPADITSTSDGTLLKSDSYEGLELFIPSDSSIIYPEGHDETITMSLVDSEQLPFALPSGVPKCRAAVFGPSGLRVDAGTPMKVTIPNDLGLPKGEKLLLVTMDGATGGWSAAGVAEVTEDEQHVVSQDGHGLTHFSVILPMPTGAQIEPYREDKEVALDDAVKGGSKVQIGLPGFKLLNRVFQPNLVYSSLAAAPTVHMTAIFRGMKEITTASRMIDHVHIKDEASVKRVEYFADYSLWLREFRDHKGTEYFNEKYSDNRFHFVTYLPADSNAPILPMPDSMWYGGTLGPKYQWVLDRMRQQEWTIKLFEIDMSLSVRERVAVWPESITGRYLFSDLDSGEFTLLGPLTPIGPEPHEGEEDTRESFPRLPVDTLLSYHIDPRLPDGTFYPTGLYSWLGQFDVKGRSYSQIQSSQTAKKGSFNYDGIKWMLDNSEGEKKEELQQLLGVLEKAHDLHRNGPIYQSKYSYGDPLDYLSNEQAGQTIIHNLANSSFGAGWKLEEQHELIPVGRNQVLMIGPEGKQVFTVDNKIQQVRLAYLEKMAYSHDGSKIYAISRAGTDWIVDKPSLSQGSFTYYVQTLVSSKAFALRYPTKEEFVRALVEALMDLTLSEDALNEWLVSDVFRFGQTPQGTWNAATSDLFVYSEPFLRHLITVQYRTALDREPKEEEFLSHQDEVILFHYNNPMVQYDTELHAEKLMVIITDLFYDLRHEMNIHDGFDWYIYIWKRVKGVEPTLQELSPMINGIARNGKQTPDATIRLQLHQWLVSEYWWKVKMDHLYERLLGFPRYRDHGIRVYENGEERDLGYYYPKVSKYMITARYRCQRHPTSTNPQTLFLSPQEIERSPRELYHDGPTHPIFKGIVEREDGVLFLSDSNSNHIYVLAKDTSVLPPYLQTYDLNGDYYQASVTGRPNTYMPFEPIDYYDEHGNLINLPEDEAKWEAAYMEYTHTWFTLGKPALKGFTPDGNILNEDGERVMDLLVDTPGGIALDNKDRLCFAETGNHRVRRIDIETGELITLAGNGESSGYDPAVIDPLKTAIPEPTEVVYSKRKRALYILFHIGLGQQCIGKIDRAGYYKHVAGAPVPGTGTLDTGGDARFFKLTGATSLALSPSGELFVSLANQHRVMVITPDGFIDTAAGNGESGQPKDGGPALQASLGKPDSIACDPNGNLLINDHLNKSLRIVNLGLCEYDSNTYFRPPLGYFQASLERHRKGKWIKKYKDGSRVHFDRKGRHTHTIDRNGNETNYLYEGDLLKKVIYPAGGKLEFSYDAQGKLNKIKDHTGRETSIQVSDGRLTSLENAEGTLWEFAYDPDGRMLRMNQGEESEITYSYNDYGRLIAQTTNGKLTQIERPDDLAAGNLDQENQEALVAFQNQTVISTAEGSQSSYKLEHGRLTELINSGDGVMRVRYNLDGLPEIVTRPSGSQITYAYNDFGDQIRVEDTFTGSVIESLYDEQGRKLEEHNSLGIKSLFEYDQKGNLIRSRLMHGEELQELSHQSFDNQGLLRERHKKGVITTYEYNDQGNLINEQRGTLKTLFDRDLAGNILSESKGPVTRQFIYDAFNQLIRATERDDQTNYEYDNRGNLIRVTDPNNANQLMSYDGRNRMIGFENPKGSRWEFGFDWEDRLIRTVYPNGKELTRVWNSSTEVFEVCEDKVSSLTYFGKKDVRSGSNENGTFVYKIDEAGRKIGQSQFLDDNHFQLSHQVDAMNRVLKLESPGEDVSYEYGTFGRLEAIRCGSWEMQFKYDADSGRLITLKRANGLETHMTYDSSGLVSEIQEQHSSADSMVIGIDYNEAGFPTTIRQDSIGRDLSYDAKGQLVQVTKEGKIRPYAYDSIGNRISGPEGTYTYDETGQLLQSCPQFDYSWDELGRLKEKTDRNTNNRQTYEYDVNGNLIAYKLYDKEELPVIEAQYAYDAIGRRVKKVVEYRDESERNIHRKWVYNGANLFLELNETGEMIRQYLCGATPDSWLGFIENGKAYYFIKDHLGSVIGIEDEDGNKVASYEYDEFGLLTDSDNGFDNAITYTGREYDVESGLYYYRKRHYDPSLGRFIQPDMYLGTAKEPKSMINRYVYVHNNPYSYRDPSGLSPADVISAAGDAAMWVVDAIWEILKFLLLPNGEAVSPVEGGPSGTYRDSFDVTRANNAIIEGYFDAQEWLAELIDQSIGKLLRELWDIVSGLFDWSLPDIFLPELSDVVHSDFEDSYDVYGGSNLVTHNNNHFWEEKDDVVPPLGQLTYLVGASVQSPAGRNIYYIDSNLYPNYLLLKSLSYRSNCVLVFRTNHGGVSNVELYKGNVRMQKLDPKKLIGKYFEDQEFGIINPGELPFYDYKYRNYFYFDIGNLNFSQSENYKLKYTYYGQSKSMNFSLKWI